MISTVRYLEKATTAYGFEVRDKGKELYSGPDKIDMDGLLKRLFHLNSRSVLDLLNTLYGTSFDESARIDYSSTEFTGDDLKRSVADLFINVYQDNRVFRFHIEFELDYDNGIIVRMFRYGFEKAKELLDLSDLSKPVLLEFPEPRVIFIEENKNIPEELKIKLLLPSAKKATFKVPVTRYWLFSAQRLYQEGMYLLLPLQAFHLRKSIRSLEKSRKSSRDILWQEYRQRLLELISEIIQLIDRALRQEKITPEDAGEMYGILNYITAYLYRRYPALKNVDQEVTEMIKTFYDQSLVDKGKAEGIKEGIKEGKAEGKAEGIKEIITALLLEKEDCHLVSPEIEHALTQVNDLDLLKKWSLTAARAKSAKEFVEQISSK
ncbi:MAG: hypothetical protein C4554_07410 [Dethiobacter sp.]|nr:MAG: hypothetical protein C4554_07410 [Dethiobacter sp.]